MAHVWVLRQPADVCSAVDHAHLYLQHSGVWTVTSVRQRHLLIRCSRPVPEGTARTLSSAGTEALHLWRCMLQPRSHEAKLDATAHVELVRTETRARAEIRAN